MGTKLTKEERQSLYEELSKKGYEGYVIKESFENTKIYLLHRFALGRLGEPVELNLWVQYDPEIGYLEII